METRPQPSKAGICALILSILKGWTPEQSLLYIEKGVVPPPGRKGYDTLDGVDMRVMYIKGMSTKEIAEVYGISINYVTLVLNGEKLKGDNRYIGAAKIARVLRKSPNITRAGLIRRTGMKWKEISSHIAITMRHHGISLSPKEDKKNERASALFGKPKPENGDRFIDVPDCKA